jgi:hypothetical protein
MYKDLSILDDEKCLKKVHYFISKAGDDNENPICSYSDIILKKYDTAPY